MSLCGHLNRAPPCNACQGTMWINGAYHVMIALEVHEACANGHKQSPRVKSNSYLTPDQSVLPYDAMYPKDSDCICWHCVEW